LPRPVGQENGAGIGDGCNTARWRGVPSDTGKVIGTAWLSCEGPRHHTWYGSRHWGLDLAEHGGDPGFDRGQSPRDHACVTTRPKAATVAGIGAGLASRKNALSCRGG
jgi:hypothetical protein